MYQARLTESLISYQENTLNLTLKELIDKEFKILLFQDKKTGWMNIEGTEFKDLLMFKFAVCFSTRFCKQLFLNQFLDPNKNSEFSKNLHCVTTPWKCPYLFSDLKFNILKIPQLLMIATNYSFLVSQLSSCKDNTVLIHNRPELHKIVKPKLPKASHRYRKKFKYLPILSSTLEDTVYACDQDVENLITFTLKKYVQHGLYTAWVNLASMLMFSWNTGTNEHSEDLANTITLNSKFLGIIFAGLSAYALSIVVLACEQIWFYCMTSTQKIKKIKSETVN